MLLTCFWISFFISSSVTLILLVSPYSFKINPRVILFFADSTFLFSLLELELFGVDLSSLSIKFCGTSTLWFFSNWSNISFFEIEFKAILYWSAICFFTFSVKSSKSLAPNFLAKSSSSLFFLGLLMLLISHSKIAFLFASSFFGWFLGKVDITFFFSPFFNPNNCLSKPCKNKSLPSSIVTSFPFPPSNSLSSTVAW